MRETDWEILLAWNSDPELLYFSEGDDVASYTLEEIQGIYRDLTFVGRDPVKSIDENWPRFREVWPPLVRLAEENGVRIGIENCPMLFTRDEWPGGKTLASASGDRTVRLWDIAWHREVAALRGTLAFCSVDFSPDGKTLATGSVGGPIQLWNVTTGREMLVFPGPVEYAPVAFSPDGQFLASGSGRDDRSVLLWRAAPFAETDVPAGAGPRRAPR